MCAAESWTLVQLFLGEKKMPRKTNPFSQRTQNLD